MFKPLVLKYITNGDNQVIFTLPPVSLHTNLLGPENNAIELMESKWPHEMKTTYKNNLKKSGDSPGGKFNDAI